MKQFSFTFWIVFMLAAFMHVGIKAQNHPNGVDFLIEGVQYPDFTYAGVPGGIPANPPGNTYYVTDYSGTDRQKAQAAVDAAESAGGGIVYFPAGTYYFDDRVVIDQDNIVIRGAGQNQTTIVLQGAASNAHETAAFSFLGAGDVQNVYNFIMNDVEKGDRIIEIQDGSAFSAGDFVRLRIHMNDLIKSNDFYRKKYVRYDEDVNWSYAHQGTYLIESISGNFIKLSQPIRITFTKSPDDIISGNIGARGSYMRPASVIRNCGVEDLRIETEEFAETMYTGGVYFTYAYACWVKDVYIRYAGSIPVNFTKSKNIEVRGVTADNAYNTGGGGNGYLPLWSTSDGLMEDITADSLRHAPNFQGSANGCVFRNSYFEDNNGEWHGGYTAENLMENITINNVDGLRGVNALISNKLDDDISGHDPHLHGQVVYNCDLQIHKNNCQAILLGGLMKNWVFAYNRILNNNQQPTLLFGDYADSLFFIGNNIGMMNYSSHEREYAVKFQEHGWDTVNLAYTTASNHIDPHFTSVIFRDNVFHGYPDNKIWDNDPGSALIKENNTIINSYSEPARPSPAVPSIVTFQKDMKADQPTVTISKSFSGYETASTFNVTVSVSGGSTYGTCSKVKLYGNDLLIGEDNTAPYEFNDVAALEGILRLKAEAVFDSEKFYDKTLIKVLGTTGNEYTLTTVFNNGSVSPSAGSYIQGAVVELTATADETYKFDHWSGDASGFSNPYSLNMNSNKTVTANFVPLPRYTLTLTNDGNGSAAASPASPYYEGDEVEITATWNTGYKFDKWVGDVDAVDEETNPLIITMDADKSIQATFVSAPVPTSPLTPTDDAYVRGGSYKDNNYGSDQVLYTKLHTGGDPEYHRYSYFRFNLAGLGSVTDAKFRVYQSENNGSETQNLKIVHNSWTEEDIVYEGRPEPSGNAIGSWTTGSNGWKEVDVTTEVNNAILNGYISFIIEGTNDKYVGYHSKENTNKPELTFTTGSTTQYTLTTSATNGDITLDPTGGTYNEDTDVEATASADEGYSFVDWEGAATGSTNPVTITMTENKSLTANFAINTYTLTTDVNNSSYGSVSVDPDQTSYDHGTDVTIIASPASGYKFDDWTGSSETNDTIVVTMDGDKSITGNFSEITEPIYTLTVENGSGTGSDYTEDQVVNISANTAPSGQTFDAWTGNTSYVADVNSSSTTVTMPAQNISVTATYKEISGDPITEIKDPVDDAYIYSAKWADDDTYNNTNLAVNNTSNGIQDAYLKFDLNDMNISGNVTSAKLQLYVSTWSSGPVHKYLYINDNNWNETTLTWNNQPTDLGTQIAQHTIVKRSLNDIEFNAAGISAVQNSLGGEFTVKVSQVSGSANYYSKEKGNFEGPYLVIEGTGIKSAKAVGLTNMYAGMKLYPNPTSAGQALNIELIGFENETSATISIMDISGRIAYSTSVQTQNLASQRVSISLDGVSAGMYMVSVHSNNKVINQRLIVR